VAKRLEQVLQEDLPLALLVASQVLAAVAHEVAHGTGEVRAGGSAGARHVDGSQIPGDRIGRI
jgi:hypothetical protein